MKLQKVNNANLYERLRNKLDFDQRPFNSQNEPFSLQPHVDSVTF